MAITWMMALVEQPMAMATTMAFRYAARVWMRAGVRSSQTISTMRRPDSEAMRIWLASAAGIDDAPGRLMPSVSAMAVMVLAVPIVMQVPWLRAMPPSMPIHSAWLRSAGAALVPVFPGVRAGAEHVALVVAAQHRPGRHVDGGHAGAGGAQQQARRGLVAAAHQHRAIHRMRADQLLGLDGEQVAVEHGGRLDRAFRRARWRAAPPGSRRPAGCRA